jgi:hypothetical protein
MFPFCLMKTAVALPGRRMLRILARTLAHLRSRAANKTAMFIARRTAWAAH